MMSAIHEGASTPQAQRGAAAVVEPPLISTLALFGTAMAITGGLKSARHC
jgi:hypothetical protein